mgnify:CR=1 FL=1
MDKIIESALNNPTVESLTQALLYVVNAYKALEVKCEQLERENERLRRQLNNNSKNSSKPSSTDQKPTKAANKYNSREKTNRKKGAQAGHTGKGLSKEFAQSLIDSGDVEHRIVGVGEKSDQYSTRYVLDLVTKVSVTEIRFYHGRYIKSTIPEYFSCPVMYGNGIKSLCTLLYSEGVVSNDRIKTIIDSLSGNKLSISEGAVYNFCQTFVSAINSKYDEIRSAVLSDAVVATDATTISIDGLQKYIRNFSTTDVCLYESQNSKSIACLNDSVILPHYTGILEHDHEVALYHYGSEHGECNAHLFRYLEKTTEESGNLWSGELKSLLSAANRKRSAAMVAGQTVFDDGYVADIETQYDNVLTLGEKQNEKTKGFTAKREERALLRRLRKYKENILLFLHDFRVPFTNNVSERDLRKCKNRQKMSGGFRNADGCDMYCKILSVIETWKREGKNLLQEIKNSFDRLMPIPALQPAFL